MLGGCGVSPIKKSGEQAGAIVNTTSVYTGVVLVNDVDAEDYSAFQIKATGPWKITHIPLGSLRRVMTLGIVIGYGDETLVVADTKPTRITVVGNKQKGYFGASAIAAGALSRVFKGGAISRALFGITDRLFPIPPVRVDAALADGEALPILGGLRVIATPGHTPGHLSFYAPMTGA